MTRRLAVLPQRPRKPDSLTVGELAKQGRYPHAGPLRMLRRQDHEVTDTALAFTGTTDFWHRCLAELFGDEQQRAWTALTLAQQTPVLLLDEPPRSWTSLTSLRCMS